MKKTNLVILISVLAIVALALNDCRYNYPDDLTSDDLVGIYFGEYVPLRPDSNHYNFANNIYRNGTYKLELHKDGTFAYEYKSVDGEKEHYSAKWEYKVYGREKLLLLYDMSFTPAKYRFTDLTEDDNRPMGQAGKIRKGKSGQLMIPVNHDSGFWLVKQQ